MRNGWHSQSLSFIDSLLQSCLIDLLVLGRVITTLSVDVVGQHAVTVVDTANRWVIVGASIRMESRLTEISCESRVSQPPCRVVKLTLALMQFLLLFRLGNNLFL
jgi:hypothetical protein